MNHPSFSPQSHKSQSERHPNFNIKFHTFNVGFPSSAKKKNYDRKQLFINKTIYIEKFMKNDGSNFSENGKFYFHSA